RFCFAGTISLETGERSGGHRARRRVPWPPVQGEIDCDQFHGGSGHAQRVVAGDIAKSRSRAASRQLRKGGKRPSKNKKNKRDSRIGCVLCAVWRFGFLD